MSSLHSMQLQGIRSFNPKIAERISFESPVTVLLGHNGAGKTTVIEALKYITSGDMPAGSKGAAFVHDPKYTVDSKLFLSKFKFFQYFQINNASEVKGQIKLKVTNAKGDTVVLTRSLLVTQKKTKSEFKTLEGVVQLIPQKGEQLSLSGKCVDIEREAILALGVSKSILNNVIFCHQEDSNWPLSEAKIVKSRFDDIFNATIYIKGMESMRTLQKLQNNEINNMKENLKFYKEDKEEAEKLTKELKNLKSKINDNEEIIDKLKSQMEPMENQINHIMELDKKYNALKSVLSAEQYEKRSLEEQIENLRSKISKFYEGDCQKLRQELNNFQKVCDQKRAMKIRLEDSKRDFDREIEDLNKSKNRKIIEKGKIEAEICNFKSKIAEKSKMIKMLSEKLDLKYSDDDKESLNQIDRALKKLKAEIESKKIEFAEKEAILDAEVQKAIGAESEFKANLRFKEENLQKIDTNLKSMQLKLQEIETSRKLLDELDEEINDLKSKIEFSMNDFDEEKTKKEICSLNEEKQKLEKKLQKLQKLYFELQKSSGIRLKLANLNEDFESKKQKRDDLLEKYDRELEDRFGGVSNSELRSNLEGKLSKIKQEIDVNDVKMREIQNEMAKNESSRSSLKNQIWQKENELKEYEEKMLQVSFVDNSSQGEDESNYFDRILENLRLDLENIRFEKGRIEGSEYVFTDYAEKLTKKPCCPLCKRNFSDRDDAKSLINDLKRNLADLPLEKRRLNDEISKKEEKLTSMHQLQPTVALAEKLKTTEIPRLKSELDGLISQYRKLKIQENELESKLSKFKNDQILYERILPDFINIGHLEEDCSNLRDQIDQLKKEIPADNFDWSDFGGKVLNMDELRREQENLQRSLKSINLKLENVQKDAADARERLHVLRNRLNDAQSRRVDVERRRQTETSLRSDVRRSNDERRQYVDDLENCRRETSPVRRRLDMALKNRSTMIADRDAFGRRNAERLDDLQTVRRRLDDFERLEREFRNCDYEKSITRLEEELENLDSSLKEKKRELKENDEKISSIQESLEMQETYRRNLSDNLELKTKLELIETSTTKIRNLTDQIEKLTASGGGLDASTLRQKYTNLTKNYSEILGRLNEQKSTAKKYESQLSTEKYRSAGEKFKDKFLDLIVTRTAVLDLKKFEKAFESCLMAYHREKMDEINFSIRKLWEKIYKGDDIDYIQIRAESSSETASSSDNRRRAYNYRVVMTVNGVELDMRGRCSAGQKVLASIVIRVALAEVFCLDCGILALDEPTTNLDAANMRSLADALANLIDERSVQKNFQLILITHDEEFVSILARQHAIEKVCRVYKDVNGFSHLQSQDVAEMELLSQNDDLI
uniref:DNA repair protein RAD50 n=1 Tax=Romanomermis culicivorax TaxID=13658 RepID=A0A915KT73_ROMCU